MKGDVVENMHFAFWPYFGKKKHASPSQIGRSWDAAPRDDSRDRREVDLSRQSGSERICLSLGEPNQGNGDSCPGLVLAKKSRSSPAFQRPFGPCPIHASFINWIRSGI